MTGAEYELIRLLVQAEGARSRLDALLIQREAAQEGRGLSPKPADIDRAREMAETAERLLSAHARTARTS